MNSADEKKADSYNDGWEIYRLKDLQCSPNPSWVTVENCTTKRYGTLFICLTTTAVHLEVATSLSTEDFLMTLCRFLALYGTPASIISDNGTDFIGEKENS